MILRYYIKFIFNQKGYVIKKDITSIAIGGFDGMHLAHQQLFKQLDSNGAIVVICTGYANLSVKTYRERHTKFPLFFYPLDDIRHLEAEQFISLLQEEFPSLKKIVVGYDFHFGHKASSNTDDLKSLFNGEVVVVDEYKVNSIAVHSRVIRDLLREGEIQSANELLGYNYCMVGYTIKGQGLGKKQFVPTINIDVRDFLIPGEGIYITKTIVSNVEYDSVSFVGHRVSTDGKFACETHLIDQELDDDVPHTVEVKFYQKIRNNKKYEDPKDLKLQILDDITQAKVFFKKR